jgi:hypothetical protein
MVALGVSLGTREGVEAQRAAAVVMGTMVIMRLLMISGWVERRRAATLATAAEAVTSPGFPASLMAAAAAGTGPANRLASVAWGVSRSLGMM